MIAKMDTDVACEICGANTKTANSLLYFGAAKIWACVVCTQSSVGYSIAYADEKTFEQKCIGKSISLPKVDANGLYNLGVPSKVCLNLNKGDPNQRCKVFVL